jgi:hypothetical protein
METAKLTQATLPPTAPSLSRPWPTTAAPCRCPARQSPTAGRSRQCSARAAVRSSRWSCTETPRTLAEHQETVRKARRHPELAVVVGAQLHAHPLAERGRAFADVHRHVEHGPLHHAHQLALRLLDLVVQAAQHAFAAAAVVVLHELVVGARGLVEGALVEALEKKPRASPNTLGSISTTSGMASRVACMGSLSRLVSAMRSRYCP